MPFVNYYYLQALKYLGIFLLCQHQVQAFLGRQPRFTALPPEQVADALGERSAGFREAVQRSPEGLLMTPRRTQTDGFFVALMAKQPG